MRGRVLSMSESDFDAWVINEQKMLIIHFLKVPWHMKGSRYI